jgi:hypothetical protein
VFAPEITGTICAKLLAQRSAVPAAAIVAGTRVNQSVPLTVKTTSATAVVSAGIPDLSSRPAPLAVLHKPINAYLPDVPVKLIVASVVFTALEPSLIEAKNAVPDCLRGVMPFTFSVIPLFFVSDVLSMFPGHQESPARRRSPVVST